MERGDWSDYMHERSDEELLEAWWGMHEVIEGLSSPALTAPIEARMAVLANELTFRGLAAEV